MCLCLGLRLRRAAFCLVYRVPASVLFQFLHYGLFKVNAKVVGHSYGVDENISKLCADVRQLGSDSIRHLVIWCPLEHLEQFPSFYDNRSRQIPWSVKLFPVAFVSEPDDLFLNIFEQVLLPSVQRAWQGETLLQILRIRRELA
jgi:hypothetical protein